MKFERTRDHFLTTLFAAVAVLESEVSYLLNKTGPHRLINTNTVHILWQVIIK